MSDSNSTDGGGDDRRRLADERVAAIKRWAAYIDANPPAVWGPQLNAIVEDQLEAAEAAGFSADHRKRVEAIAAELEDQHDAR